MKLYQIKRRIILAIDTFRLNDNYLLKTDCSERSIAHRLAVCLESTFGKEYDIDCEYNRDGADPKRLASLKAKHQNTSGCVYPDIIVHRRGSNRNNLLAIEIKKSNNQKTKDFDFEKLELYTSELHYSYGIHIEFFVEKDGFMKPLIRLYKDGKEIDWDFKNCEYNSRWN